MIIIKMKKFVQNVCAIGACLLIALSVCACSCSGGKKSSKPRSYVEAVSANDYVTAHEILDQYLQRAIDWNGGNFSNYEYIEKFWGVADHIYKAEMMYLIEMNDQAANKRLINTLAMMNIIGTKPVVNENYHSKYTKEYSYYIFVSRYNLLCDEILNISLLNNNREMARQVLMMYKEDAILRKKLVDGYEQYTFTFSYRSKEAATKKYNDAIKNGLLN